MNYSTKSVKPLKDLIGERIFTIGRSKANEIDIVTGRPCVFVMINGVSHYIPVDTPTPIPYNAFTVLRDLGILTADYDDGEVLREL